MMWSCTQTSIVLQASFSFFVMVISSWEGLGFPLGWLWANRTAAAPYSITFLTNSLGYTAEVVSVPSNRTSVLMIAFLPLRKTTKNCSLNGSVKKGLRCRTTSSAQLILSPAEMVNLRINSSSMVESDMFFTSILEGVMGVIWVLWGVFFMV